MQATEARVEPNVEKLLDDIANDLDKLLAAKHVIGEPMTFGDTTVIPLMSVGVGFGGGGGTGRGKNAKGDGIGGGEGGGAGGGIRPLGVIIVNRDGVKVVPVPAAPSALEKIGAAIGAAMQKRTEKAVD